jgi:hypothetical protein
MIEAYLFHAMLAVQIVLGSILIPRRVLRLVDHNIARNPPAADGMVWVGRMRQRYRIANHAIVGIGLVLMAAFFSYMQRADWTDGPVEAILPIYFLLQCLPFAVGAFVVASADKAAQSALPAEKRRAVLQRRGLFDFVPPLVVALTLLCYVLFTVLVFYIERNPFPGFAGAYVNLGIVTFAYAATAFMVYRFLYGRKARPQQTHAERMQETGTMLKVLVYSCLAGVVALMSNMLLILLDQQRLEPFALCTYFVAIGLWLYRNMSTAPLVATANGLPSGSAH